VYARFEQGDRLAFSRWKQQLLVLSACRILHPSDTGWVASKRVSGERALDALDTHWSALIRRALDDRPDPWERVHQAAEPDIIRATMDFIDGVARWCDRRQRRVYDDSVLRRQRATRFPDAVTRASATSGSGPRECVLSM
jgi:Aminoglycoside adenylyltransferase, C-terminal domain